MNEPKHCGICQKPIAPEEPKAQWVRSMSGGIVAVPVHVKCFDRVARNLPCFTVEKLK